MAETSKGDMSPVGDLKKLDENKIPNDFNENLPNGLKLEFDSRVMDDVSFGPDGKKKEYKVWMSNLELSGDSVFLIWGWSWKDGDHPPVSIIEKTMNACRRWAVADKANDPAATEMLKDLHRSADAKDNRVYKGNRVKDGIKNS